MMVSVMPRGRTLVTGLLALGLCAGGTVAATPASARNAVAFMLFHAQPKTKITKFTATITGMNNETGLVGEVEYDPSTCQEVSPGSWAVNGKAPRHGTIANTIGQGTVGGCGSTIFDYGVINYTWTKGKKATKDAFKANWTTPDGQFNLPFRFILTLVQ